MSETQDQIVVSVPEKLCTNDPAVFKSKLRESFLKESNLEDNQKAIN